MENTVYVLNPQYRLKSDIKRVILYKKDTDPIERDDISDFLGFVHPLYALLFSLLDGVRSLKSAISDFSSVTGLSIAAVQKLIKPLLKNDEELKIDFESNRYYFPKNLLIKKRHNEEIFKYNPNDFMIPKKELDLKSWRLYRPLDIHLMINTKCVTDCIYCYADRRRVIDCTLPIDRLAEIILEAKQLGVRSFDITGGELFLYKNWEQLLVLLVQNGYPPYISTKKPISGETINKLKEIGINRIQISIDSVVKDEMKALRRVNDDYYSRLMETIEYLDKKEFDIYTNSQITRINQNSSKKLLEYLLNLKNIKRINFGAVGYSLYKDEKNFLAIRPDLNVVKEFEAFINSKKQSVGKDIQISMSGYTEKKGYIDVSDEVKKENFWNRARCSGNFYAFIILPDGNVTVCEELYWHPKFIIGDLKTESIAEMWNSEKALGLYNLTPDKINNGSACKNCNNFSECHVYEGVCWKDVLFAYGEDKWDYPDPRCPFAPEPERIFWIE